MLTSGIGFDMAKVTGLVQQPNHVTFALNEVRVAQ